MNKTFILSMLVVTVASSSAFAQKTTPEQHPDPFEIKLTAHGAQSFEKICVDVEVVNKSSEALGWDSEYSVCSRWIIRSYGPNGSDKRRLTHVSIGERLPPADKKQAQKRFVLIEPGKGFARTIVLTEPCRGYGFDQEVDPVDKGVHSWGYEQLFKYTIPRQASSLEITFDYIGDLWKPWTLKKTVGSSMDELKLCGTSVTSNLLRIKLK